MKRLAFLLWCGATLVAGCSWLGESTMRSQSPEEVELDLPVTRLVGEFAVPTGLQPARVEAVGLVTGLHGTGSDPHPSPQRAALLEEMQARDVAKPNTLLASGNVSLVLVQGYLRPGIQKGDRFDIEVRVPSQSETSSLRGGYLLETRLTEMMIGQLDHQLHRGHLLALSRGPVLVDPMADPKKDKIAVCRGRIPGGGVALKSRPLGLVLTPDHQCVANSSRVANAINKRFHTFQSGIQTGVAKAKTDQYIELLVHPHYKDNIARYMQVVRAVAVSESATERMDRIALLERQLLDPETAAEAAIQLEAIGVDGVDALVKAVTSKDPEVKFYAAEALAYLDCREAAEPLAEIARNQPAFRVFALTALSTMQDYEASDQLRELLSVPSAETRYGAFRALWTINNQAPLVHGEVLGGQFHYHVLDVAGPPMIHSTRSRLAELVIFGAGQKLTTPLAVSAGNEIMVTSSGGDEVSVSKYSVADGDQKRIVSTNVDEVIRAIVELGGTYPDVVQALAEAKKLGSLDARIEIDALPQAGRTYDRLAKGDEEPSTATPASPSPELFAKKKSNTSSSEGDESDDTDEDFEEDTPRKKGFFGKLFSR